MTRFALGFVTALIALVLAVIALPVDVTVRAESARNTKAMVPEVVVPLSVWCEREAKAVIASSDLAVDTTEVLRNSINYPFVTHVARISTAADSVVSPESSKAAFGLANRLLGMCLPKSYLTFRGADAFDQAMNTIGHIGRSNGTAERSWVLLEVDPAQQVVTLSRLPEDIAGVPLR
jgi:hypothetical protein